MKILAVVPWSKINETPQISAVSLDTETGHSETRTEVLGGFRWAEGELVRYSLSSGPPLTGFIKASNPDKLVSFVADGPCDGSHYYPLGADGVPILREVFASSATRFLESQKDVQVLRDGDVIDIFGYDMKWPGLRSMSNHLSSMSTWESFCYALCITYNRVFAKRVKEIEREQSVARDRRSEQQAISKKALELEASKAEEARKQTLEMLGD